VTSSTDARDRPVRRRDRATKGDRREEQILTVTRGLLAERSMSALTIDEIASAAGISRTSFYFYFPSKQAVLAALMEQVWDGFSRTHGWFETAGPGREELVGQLRGAAAIWKENGPVLACTMEGASAYPPLQDFMDRARARFVDGLAAKIRRDRAAGLAPGAVEPETLARMVGDLRDQRLSQVASREGAALDAALEELAEVISRMVYGTC
jgi:TetR/AcrR family transcriptional regulator, ethionamide resistance regulator